MKNILNLKNTLLTAGSGAITHIPNCCMVRILSLFTIIRISRKRILANLVDNEKILATASKQEGSFFTPGSFIENQNEWENVRFGLSTMKYSGCEIMAVYNALLDLGNKMTARDMAELISTFEKKGSELQGRWGCSPKSIYRYFSRLGYRVTMTIGANPATVNSIGEGCDSVIITACDAENAEIAGEYGRMCSQLFSLYTISKRLRQHLGNGLFPPTAKKRTDHSDQHASSCLLVVQWTIPPYEIFRFTFPSISTPVPFHFSLSSVYCNGLNFRNTLPFRVLMHISFCLQLVMSSCF